MTKATAWLQCPRAALIATVGLLTFAGDSLLAQTPPITTGLALWLRADAGVTTNASGLVSSWADQSGNGNGVSQGNPSLQPAWLGNGINGRPALHFTGGLLDNTANNILTSGSARTVFIVADATSGNGGALFTFRRSNAGSTTIYSDLFVNFGVNAFYVYTDGVNVPNNATIPDSNLSTIYQPFVSAFSSAGAGNPIHVFLNGTDRGATHHGGSVSAETGLMGFTVGAREDYPMPWLGNIAEILVYDSSLSASDRLWVANYLGDKYAVPVPEPTAAWLGLLALAGGWALRRRRRSSVRSRVAEDLGDMGWGVSQALSTNDGEIRPTKREGA